MSTAPVRVEPGSSASTRARTASVAAIGCTRERSHSGIGWRTSRVPIWRITSNDVEPAPMTTPARSATDDAEEDSSSSSTSRRDVMCSESSSRGTSGTRPER